MKTMNFIQKRVRCGYAKVAENISVLNVLKTDKEKITGRKISSGRLLCVPIVTLKNDQYMMQNLRVEIKRERVSMMTNTIGGEMVRKTIAQIEDDIYDCEFCNTSIPWGGADERRGELWSCEQLSCGKTFCVECFKERFGADV